ncbi:MAG TPA: AI-2E family transporter [Feifaniaceae bacterium]|nr:AI-2E family transporter [Feifaniaceae bacterium]
MRKYLLLITYTVVLLMLLYRIDGLWAAAGSVLHVLSPVFVAVAVAYVVNLPLRFFQYKVFPKWERHRRPGLRRAWRIVSMLCAYLVALAALVGTVALIVPRVVESIIMLATNFSGYLNRFQVWSDGIQSALAINPEVGAVVMNLWEQLITFIQGILGKAVSGALTFTVGLTTGVYQFALSVMLSIFMLYNKDKLLVQARRLCAVVFGPKTTRRVSEVLHMANGIFSRFIAGQLVEAVILGVLCFIGMTIFNMHYALLISTIIAVTALIPILGPLIGTIPCAVILLVIEPMQAVWFVVFIIILQQLESNLIYPRVVGNAVGLSGLWVLMSVIVGGGLFGIWGMLLGTPVMAVVYRLVREWVRTRENAIGPPEERP